jgi:prevent-host-death family protein
MQIVTMHKAKTNLSKLIEAACRGEEIVIAKGKKPVVKLTPLVEQRPKRTPGAWKGKLVVGPEFFEPLPEEELEAWYK